MKKLGKSLTAVMLLLVINGCNEEPKPKLVFPHIKVYPERGTTMVYFEELDSNKTHQKGSLDTVNAQNLWTVANVYKYDAEFYRNQLVTMQKFITALQSQTKE